MSGEPAWVSKVALLVLHDRSIALHGGAPGLRDEGLLESALARPSDHFHYEGETDICVLAAIHLIALTSNHPFVDGNKRAPFLASGVFLRRNGRRLTASQAEAVRMVLSVAAGARELDAVAQWFRRHTEPLA